MQKCPASRAGQPLMYFDFHYPLLLLTAWSKSKNMQRINTDFPHPIREIENTWIPLSDGARLAARIWLPVDAEEKPVPT